MTPEPWMILDLWGNPVPERVLSDRHLVHVSLKEIRRLSEGKGELATALKKLVAKYEEGDAIVFYDSPQPDWDRHMGSRGYAMIRAGYIVADVLMAMN